MSVDGFNQLSTKMIYIYMITRGKIKERFFSDFPQSA